MAREQTVEAVKTLTTPDGVTLRYGVWRAPAARGAVVLIHGMASNRTRWSEFVDNTALVHDWDIVSVDLRGHGESTMRTRLGMGLWCEDLLRLLDAEGYDRAVFVGHSLGAHLALQFAVRHPDRTRGLVLIDPVFKQTLRGRRRWQVYLWPLVALVAEAIWVANALGLRRRTLPGRDMRALDVQTRKKLLASGNVEEFVRQYSSAWADMKFFPVASYVKELSEMMRPVPLPSKVNAPVLVLLSRGATYTDPQKTERILKASPNTEHVALDAYHWPLTETPDQVREAIERWIGKLPKKTRPQELG